MNIVAIITARGNSRGLKNKNIVKVCGKPLISYVITALKKAKSVDKVIVTTDSPAIAGISKKYGAEVPWLRPASLARHNTPTYPVIAHAVKKLQEEGYKADYALTVQPTSPLLQPQQVDKAVSLAIKKKADSVITACPLSHDCHPYNIRTINSGGIVKFWKEKEHYKHPTRQIKPKFYTAGNLWVSSYDTIMGKGRLEGKKNYKVEIDKIYALDIDTKEDIPQAERVIKLLLK